MSETTSLNRFDDQTRDWSGYVVSNKGELVYMYGLVKELSKHPIANVINYCFKLEMAEYLDIALPDHILESEWSQEIAEKRHIVDRREADAEHDKGPSLSEGLRVHDWMRN